MRCCLILFLLGIFFTSKAQVKTIGLPAIKNISKREYMAGNQNWSVAQAEDGRIYFGNNLGVLEYDGVRWNTYPIGNGAIVRSVAIGHDGSIIAAGYNEIGAFSACEKGQLTYKSWVGKLPPDKRDFGEIWRIHPTDSCVYAQSFSALFKFHNDTVEVLTSEKDLKFFHTVGDRFFVQDRKRGILELKGNKLELILKYDLLVGENDVRNVTLLKDSSFLIGTYNQGIYKYKDGKIKPLNNELSRLLKTSKLYSFLKLQDNFFFGTLYGGLLITDSEFNIVQIINEAAGLQNNSVLAIFKDRYGQVWLGLDNGISYLEINSAFTYFNSGVGVEGTGYDAVYHDSKLYLATNQGVYSTGWDGSSNATLSSFNQLNGSYDQIWNLSVVDGQLFCGHNSGSSQVKNGKLKEISHVDGGWNFIPLMQDSSVMLGGTYTNIILYKKENGQWKNKGALKGFYDVARTMLQDSDSSIWVCHGYKGIYNFKMNEQLDSAISLKFYDVNHGLPSNLFNYVYRLNGELVFGTQDGFFSFNKEKERFEPNKYYTQLFGKKDWIGYPTEDMYGNLWFVNDGYLTLLKKKGNDTYQRIEDIFLKHENALPRGFENITFLRDGSMIYGLLDGFARYDIRYKHKSYQFPALLSRIAISSASDSILWGGHGDSSCLKPIELPYRYNSLTFDFGATYFESSDQLKFRYRLLGLDDEWSVWRTDRHKEFTNIPSGSYIFEVEALNIYGEKSRRAKFAFSVLAPWYASKLAFFLYVLFSALLVWTIVEYNAKRLKAANRRLESQVEQRTTEIREQNTILEQHAEEIAVQKENLTQKHKILLAQNTRIEKQNEVIKHSLHYALTIQQAALPLEANISQLFEHFVLFLPRDIVSGDFYWWTPPETIEKENSVFFAAVDCTGHGVPGALVSMIGNRILNEIVRERGIYEPAKILENLHNGVYRELKQKTSDNHDGMDICLCRIDNYNTNNPKVVFAGAKRPLFFWDSTKKELYKIIGTRKHIGGHFFDQAKNSFNQHEISLHRGDMLYLSTDGYVDQNNRRRKRFGSERLFKLLQEIASLPAMEQEKRMLTALEEYEAGVLQRDDITFMGIRL